MHRRQSSFNVRTRKIRGVIFRAKGLDEEGFLCKDVRRRFDVPEVKLITRKDGFDTVDNIVRENTSYRLLRHSDVEVVRSAIPSIKHRLGKTSVELSTRHDVFGSVGVVILH